MQIRRNGGIGAAGHRIFGNIVGRAERPHHQLILTGIGFGKHRKTHRLRSEVQRGNIGLRRLQSAYRRFIGQFLVRMNGADTLIFTAGIGENSPSLRAAVCANLEFCGLELDPELNAATRATETIISKPSSKIEVRVIPTNEEIVIARNAWAKLQESH